mgnify:CR=1 FL=1
MNSEKHFEYLLWPFESFTTYGHFFYDWLFWLFKICTSSMYGFDLPRGSSIESALYW